MGNLHTISPTDVIPLSPFKFVSEGLASISIPPTEVIPLNPFKFVREELPPYKYFPPIEVTLFSPSKFVREGLIDIKSSSNRCKS